MSIFIYTGLPATGKTSILIKSLREYQDNGGKVVLFLSAEHPELTRRPNVRPGGRMGCRDPELHFKIDYVLKTGETIKRLEALEPNVMAVFDEAQFFRPEIVDSWHSAANRGVTILVSTPSKAQLDRLEEYGYEPIELTVPCKCNKANATSVLYEDDMIYPTHLCDDCKAERYNEIIDKLFAEIRDSDPFPGENKTYQPFYNIEAEDWDYVRPDSLARFQIMESAIERYPSLQPTVETADRQLTYLDLGCCSGFFCDAMTNLGFYSTGVDVTNNFINWARRIAKLKGQNINYVCEDAFKFIAATDDLIDVTSSFATIQWVMSQQGYQAGLECFKYLFDRTRHICIVEMGYTLEDIYKERIPDRPREIDKDWVLEHVMLEYGRFAAIEFHPAGENGIWRDVFIGYKEVPGLLSLKPQLESDEFEQVSSAQQFWDDNWVGEDFGVSLRAKRKIRQGRLRGMVPDRGDGQKSEIAIFIDGKQVEILTVDGNEFECTFRCEVDPGGMFSLRIKATPIKLKASEDKRPLAFVMIELNFT